MKTTKIFQPLKKGDRIRCAYIGPDACAVALYERSTDLGTQQYAQICCDVPNLSVCYRGTDRNVNLHRIVLHDPGIVSVALATGRPVRIDAYSRNGSEGLRQIGKECQTLYIDVPGIGSYQVSDIGGLLSGGFTIQATDSVFGHDVGRMDAAYLREKCRGYFADDIKVLRFEDDVDNSAAQVA